MQNRILVQSLLLCFSAIYLTWALEIRSQSISRIPRGFSRDIGASMRERRQTTEKPEKTTETTEKTTPKTPTKTPTKAPKKKPTTPKPGFFRTLFSVIYQQYHDTRATIGAVNKYVNDNFLPEPGTVEAATKAPDSNETTTEDNRISREEFNKIIMRNIRGLQRLFRIELMQALKQSEINYNEFRMNVSKEVGKFL